MASSLHTPGFDPSSQDFTLIKSDGGNTTVSLQQVNEYRLYTARLSLAYGAQLGATLLLLLVLFLLTRAEKRKSGIFTVNALCLIANSIRCILLSCYVTSTLWHPYTQLVEDTSHVSMTDVHTSVAASVFTLIVTVLIMISLSVQVWVVCITTSRVQRYVIMGATTVTSLVAVGYKAAFVISSVMQTLNGQNGNAYLDVVLQSYITQAVAIWLYSCVFTYKLGYAIIQRRRLNMPAFGPMQIIFIMGCQTMIIPAIFTGLQFCQNVEELGMITPTVVCIFLPLSAIWAGVVNEKVVGSAGPNAHHHLIHGEFYRSASTSSYGASTGASMMDKSRQMSVCTCGTKCNSEATTPSPRKKSLLEYDDEAILVNREFGFMR
ncbi:pheromone alpha factor receptor [Pleosporales sp. CAS-2024a]